MTDHRLQAPATLRNRDPIVDVLRGVLPASGLVLEIASGSGQHVIYFAEHFPHLTFQPSDPDAAALQSIPIWTHDAGVTNVLPPVMLDAASSDWPISAADAIICINMIHIAPWEAAEALMEGAGALLGPGGVLVLYGPYRRHGEHTAPSNAAFDEDLRTRNPAWGVRNMEAVEALAAAAGFAGEPCIAMPANNFSLIFRKR